MELVDTDVLIDIQRGHAPAVAWFDGLLQLPAVSGFVVMELIQDARNAVEVKRALQFVAPMVVIWPSEADCQQALSLFAAHHLSQGLGLIDALIAASAIGRSATLLTFNTKHYRAIPGLIVASPYTR